MSHRDRLIIGHGQGLGTRLLLHSLAEIAQASRSIGFELVVVHAVDLQAVAFYARSGFYRFEDDSLDLFMPTGQLPPA